MVFIAVDLGSTNIKAAAFNERLECIVKRSQPVEYIEEDGFIEFDADGYVGEIVKIITDIVNDPLVEAGEIRQISLTGQAESLIILDNGGCPLTNAISWMDERASGECAELLKVFSFNEYASVTGQMAVLPTWPASKILWIKKNKPEIFKQAAKYVLLKDYVVYAMTDKLFADCSIATFTFYFDIYRKCYWKKMLEACGINEEQLPPLVEPCTIVGTINSITAEKTGLLPDVRVNIGTLDHFAGMIGTGNVNVGAVSLSTGTVMALALFAENSASARKHIAMHYGFIPNTHIMLPVVESGGICLEWLKKTCMGGLTFDEANSELLKRELPNEILFLPYITGTNAPEFDDSVSGGFYGLRAKNDIYDIVAAVMEGVSMLLRKNCDFINKHGIKIDHIIATGGGAKSPVWCQMQADITGLPIAVPKEKETACLGAAIISAVSEGVFSNYADAVNKVIKMERWYMPNDIKLYENKYKKFNEFYDAVKLVEEKMNTEGNKKTI